jgi:hypothetical protein
MAQRGRPRQTQLAAVLGGRAGWQAGRAPCAPPTPLTKHWQQVQQQHRQQGTCSRDVRELIIMLEWAASIRCTASSFPFTSLSFLL